MDDLGDLLESLYGEPPTAPDDERGGVGNPQPEAPPAVATRAARTFGNPVKGRIGPKGVPDPASKFVVTRWFGDGSFPQYGLHDGLDIDNGGAPGDPILAMDAGRVYQCYVDPSGALIIRIDHGGGWTTGYAHMSRFRTSQGAQVTRGQHIGDLGTTGYSTGPHVHMDTSYGNKRVDPWPHLAQNAAAPAPKPPSPGGWPAMKWRPVQQDWTTKTGNATPGGQFYVEGPGVGASKFFTTKTRVRSVAESTDGKWRELEFGAEILWIARANLDAVDGTRDPSSGSGPPTRTPAKAADAVRDKAVAAANAEAKKWGAG